MVFEFSNLLKVEVVHWSGFGCLMSLLVPVVLKVL
jgi:hypothetical protein